MLSLQSNGADHDLSHYNTGAEATCKGKFPPNKKVEYILDDVRCNGDENSLFECTHINKEKHNCRNRERAGVNCISCKCNIKLSTFITRCFVLQPKMILAFVFGTIPRVKKQKVLFSCNTREIGDLYVITCGLLKMPK